MSEPLWMVCDSLKTMWHADAMASTSKNVDAGTGAMLALYLHHCNGHVVRETYDTDEIQEYSIVADDIFDELVVRAIVVDVALGANDEPMHRSGVHVRHPLRNTLRRSPKIRHSEQSLIPLPQGTVWLMNHTRRERTNLCAFGASGLAEVLLDPRACSLCARAGLFDDDRRLCISSLRVIPGDKFGELDDTTIAFRDATLDEVRRLLKTRVLFVHGVDVDLTDINELPNVTHSFEM